MEKKIISFKGMSNVPDDGFNEAGDMALLLNMRHKGGELVECKSPAGQGQSAKIRQALFHPQSGLWLHLTEEDTLLSEVYDAGQLAVSGVKSVSLMGNTVVICFENKVEYAIWQGDRYLYLGGLPEVPQLKVSSLYKKKYFETESQLEHEFSATDSTLYNYRFQKGNIDKTLAVVYSEGGFVDRAWFRVGIRLFDGTYIVGDILEITSFDNEPTSYVNGKIGQKVAGMQALWYSISIGPSKGRYFTQLDYFVPTFKLDMDLDNWRDIIASVDLFSTGSITTFAAGTMNKDDIGVDVPDIIEIYKMRTAEQLRDAIINAEFYRIASYDVSGNKKSGIDNTSPSNMAVQETLKNVSTHSVIPTKANVLNARLHAFGYKNKYFDGYKPATTYHGDSATDGSVWTTYVYLKTDKGVVIVKKEGAPTFKQLAYYAYPDSRAYRMEVFQGSSLMRRIELMPHPVRNEAVYVNIATADAEVEESIKIGEETLPYILNYYDFPYIKKLSGAQGEQPEEKNNIEEKSTLRVSAVDNPFYFPTAQTYKFEGEIIGLASNAEAISTGQFGQYPLFVFTREGIWAMAVDASGQGAYVSQSPFSREVCDGAVCPVSGGIVFTTQRGVMAISGGLVTDLSQKLDGPKAEMLTASSNILGLIAEKSGHALPDVVPVREYIDGAKLAYNYLHNEVILSNVKHTYSYVYALTDGVWSIIDTTFDVTTNSYPELVVYNNDRQLKYEFNDGDNCTPGVVAVTRPFTLGSLEYKRLRQAALRCTYEPRLNFYLLGSNDGANFVCITGKETERDSTRRDLVTPMSRSRQYKYFAIAFAGQMHGRVTLAELLVDAGMNNNKLG